MLRVVRHAFEQVEELIRVLEHVGPPARDRVLRQRVKRESLPVKVLFCAERSLAARIDLPPIAAMARIHHALAQEAESLLGGFAHRPLLETLLPHQPREQPQHARLDDQPFRRFADGLATRSETQTVAAVGPVEAPGIPESDDVLAQYCLEARNEAVQPQPIFRTGKRLRRKPPLSAPDEALHEGPMHPTSPTMYSR